MTEQRNWEEFEKRPDEEVQTKSPFEGFPAKRMILALGAFVLGVVFILLGTVEELTELSDSMHSTVLCGIGAAFFILMVFCLFKFVKDLNPTHSHSKSATNIIS